jgi:hypothetical protein
MPRHSGARAKPANPDSKFQSGALDSGFARNAGAPE